MCRVASRGVPDATTGHPSASGHVLGTGATAAVLVLTARAALGVSAEAIAQAAGCGLSLVVDIERGRFDPTLDTVERLVNSVGLEVRAGAHRECNPAYTGVTASEVERVRAALETVREFREAHGLRPPGPPPGVQPDWDGLGAAPPRLFGAGRTRRDGGGWGAVLFKSERVHTRAVLGEIAAAVGISTDCAALIEDGMVRPPVGMIEALFGAMGSCLRVRLEPYDDHDDGLHLQAVADPERYLRRLSNGEKSFARAVVQV